MGLTVEKYEAIRSLIENEHLSQRAIAERLSISRNTVKKYCRGATVPWERKEGSGRKSSRITPEVADFIKSCLEEDEKCRLSKQQHTARRIYDRLVSECGYEGCESSVRAYVAGLKKVPRDAFVPLEYFPGESIQVDWGEATVSINGIREKINIWCMRECYSDDFYCCVFHRQNQESFLEGMRNGLEYFGGSPKKIIFDNAKVAVKEGFGLHAKATDKYLQMSAHYAFKPIFCNVASGNEKGLVEGLVGFVRRNVFVPMPCAETIDGLNAMLLTACRNYRKHTVPGRTSTVGEMAEHYKLRLTPIPPFRFDTSNTITTKVTEFSLVSFDYGKYSVPVHYIGKTVTVKGTGNTVRIMSGNTEIEVYERDYIRNGCHYRLEHYMSLLERKPRSVYNAAPVRQNVPESLIQFMERLDSPKDIVKTLRLYMEYKEILLTHISGVTTYEALEADMMSSLKQDTGMHTEQGCSGVNEISVIAPQLNLYDRLLKGGAH